ncbi:MAG: formate dehydrogenase accessory protein FdhE [Vicinamibacterales bacterium]
MTLDDWLRAHRFLEPLASVRRRVDAAVDAAVTPLPVPSDWDDYAEDFAAGVPLLQSQTPIDLEPGGRLILAVLEDLASDDPHAPLSGDAAALRGELEQDPLAPRRVVDWLLGDESWEPVCGGLLRSVGWITLSAALGPLVQSFAAWRDHDRWLRRYCPTCGALPAMAHLVGVDPGRRRFLACGRCASEWRYGRTGCPFCETESHRLASVGIEGEGGLRIDYCETCRGYLKTYSGQGDERVLLADWTSLHLDIVARDRGLKRLATSLYDLDPSLDDAPSTHEKDPHYQSSQPVR